MRTKMILCMVVCLLTFMLTPWREALALEKCHKAIGCQKDCVQIRTTYWEECREEYKKAVKSPSGQGIPLILEDWCGEIYYGTASCTTASGVNCNGYTWSPDECDSS